jgi:DNA polymerase III delta subunit
VLKGKKDLAFYLLKSSYEYGEATMVLLSNLYNSTKQLLQVQSFKGDGKITEATGLTPFQVKLASERKGRNSTGDLIYLMRLVRDTEKGIKTGAIEEQMSMPYILANYWG